MLSTKVLVGSYKTTVEIIQMDHHDDNLATVFKCTAMWYGGKLEVFLFTRNAVIGFIESDHWTIAY